MLYVIRHGKTDWNQKYKLQGRTDIPLNEEGIEMARQACERYKDVHFDVCYCSPLTRARQTAELLLEGRDVPVIYDDRLLEMGFGIYEGTEYVYDKPDCHRIPDTNEAVLSYNLVLYMYSCQLCFFTVLHFTILLLQDILECVN